MPGRKTMLVEDLGVYESDEALARAWYKPPHGTSIGQVLGDMVGAAGRRKLPLPAVLRTSYGCVDVQTTKA